MATPEEKAGSETLGSPEEKSHLTLFKDDRQEDIGAIVLSILLVAIVILLTK
jgi:hypothetical protein